MRAARWLLCALFLLGAAAPKKDAPPAPSFKEPDGFAGLKWGAPITEAERLFQLKGDKKELGRETDVQAWIKVGETLLDAQLKFLDGKFVHVFFLVDANYKDILQEAFLQRYGRPTTAYKDFLTWDGPHVIIGLNIGVPMPTGGSRTFSGSLEHRDYKTYLEGERRGRARAAAKDL